MIGDPGSCDPMIGDPSGLIQLLVIQVI